MKKCIFLICTLFLLSCSSDDNDSPNNDLKQYEVNIRVNADSSFPNIYDMAFFNAPRLPNEKFGNMGVIGFRDQNSLKAYDRCCPYHWNEIYAYFTSYNKEDNTVKCSYCKSVYSLETGKSLSGPAKEKGFALVEYLVTDKGDNIYNISNPNYKK